MKRTALLLLLSASTLFASKAIPPGYPLHATELSLEVRGNDLYPTRDNGLFHLFSVYRPGLETCDASGAKSCGNLEHFISAYQDSRNLFEPRSGPLVLSVLVPGRKVQLTRLPSQDAWGVGAVITREAVDPHYIDDTYAITVSNATVFGPARQLVVMVASYMKLTDEIGFWMRGIAGPGQPEQWNYLDAPCCIFAWNQGGSYRFLGSSPLYIAPGNDSAFNLTAYDYPLATQPFYCGIAESGMLHEILFDQMWTPAQEMRATLYKFRSKFGENKPAWDLQMVMHPVESGHTYYFRTRTVRKPFVSLDDCQAESEAWRR